MKIINVLIAIILAIYLSGCGAEITEDPYDPVEHIVIELEETPDTVLAIEAMAKSAIIELTYHSNDYYNSFQQVDYNLTERWIEMDTLGLQWAFYVYPDFGVNTLASWYCGSIWIQCLEWDINATVNFHDWGAAIPYEIAGTTYQCRHNCYLDETTIDYYVGNDFVHAYCPIPLDWDHALEPALNLP